MKRFFIFTLFASSLLSCSEDDFFNSEQTYLLYNEAKSALTRSSVSEEDFIHFIQTDKMNMILNRIVLTDSTYVLELSREQAHILEIPDSIYDLAVDIVDQYNNPSND
jgi:hypothetical protein